MPWTAADGPTRHTKKAKSKNARKQWAAVANDVLTKSGDEGKAVRIANGVIKNRKAKGK